MRRTFQRKKNAVIVIQKYARRRLAVNLRKTLYEKNKWKLISEKGASLDVGASKSRVTRSKTQRKAPTRGHHKSIMSTEPLVENYDPGKGKVLEIPGQGVMMMFDPSAVKLKKRTETPTNNQKPVEQPSNPLSGIKLRTNTTPVKREDPKQAPPPFSGFALKKVPKKEPMKKMSLGIKNFFSTIL